MTRVFEPDCPGKGSGFYTPRAVSLLLFHEMFLSIVWQSQEVISPTLFARELVSVAAGSIPAISSSDNAFIGESFAPQLHDQYHEIHTVL